MSWNMLMKYRTFPDLSRTVDMVSHIVKISPFLRRFQISPTQRPSSSKARHIAL
jgi:hypothetical protein